MARKPHTSNEVKMRWISKAYKRITINLRYDTDQKLLDWIEEHKEELGTTNIFRDGAYKIMQEYEAKNR